MTGRVELSSSFRRLLASTVASNLGDGVRLVALPLLAATITTDPFPVAAVTAATMSPWLLGPVLGTVVDRGDRRRLMVLGQLVRAAAVAVLALGAAQGIVPLWGLYVVAFVVGLGEVLVDSAAQSLIPALVEGEDLDRANGQLVMAETVTGDVVGGPLGGLLFAVGAAVPFLFDAGTFVFSAILLAGVAVPPRVASSRRPRFQEDVEVGLYTLWGDALLRPLALVVGLVNVIVNAVAAILVLFALQDLGLDERGFGLLLGVGAVGGILGAFSADRIRQRLGRGPALVGAGVGVAAGLALLAAAPNALVAGPGIALLYFGGATFNVVGRALRQAVLPPELVGRVVATFRLVGMAGVPIGALAGGALAEVVGVRNTVGVAAAAFTAVLVLLVRAARNIPLAHR